MYRYILWDVDGTLFDTYPAIAKAFRAALTGLGKTSELDQIETLARISLSYCASTLAAEHQLSEDDLARSFGEHYDRTRPEDQPPFPGVKEICEYICSIGGKNVIVTHRGRKGTDKLLSASEMTRYFMGWITREDGHPRKPDPAAFEAALKAYGLGREETIAVGDRGIDAQAGRAAGIFTCLFRCNENPEAVDLIIREFDELYRFILSGR